MAQYLHIRVEDVDLLLPALQVHEVVGLEQLTPQADGHSLWRDQVIQTRDLGEVLKRCDQPGNRSYGVVYSPDSTEDIPVLLLIDEVMGLRNPSREQLYRLPGATTNAHHLFDAFWVDNRLGAKAYRVKNQLPTDALL